MIYCDRKGRMLCSRRVTPSRTSGTNTVASVQLISNCIDSTKPAGFVSLAGYINIRHAQRISKCTTVPPPWVCFESVLSLLLELQILGFFGGFVTDRSLSCKHIS